MKQIHVREMRKMFCAVQELATKKENKNGYPKRLEAYPETKIVDGKEEILWRYRYSTECFARPIKKAYKFTIHESYREDGKVKARQAVIATHNYYDFVGGYNVPWDKIDEVARKFNVKSMDIVNLYAEKANSLRAEIEEEFQQTEEYKVHHQHELLIKDFDKKCEEHLKKYYKLYRNKSEFISYMNIYDVFGTVRNPEALKSVQRKYELSERRRTSKK